jgi:hypothetical protein
MTNPTPATSAAKKASRFHVGYGHCAGCCARAHTRELRFLWNAESAQAAYFAVGGRCQRAVAVPIWFQAPLYMFSFIGFDADEHDDFRAVCRVVMEEI